jgi:peptide/nickel transport system substrate-binding protein
MVSRAFKLRFRRRLRLRKRQVEELSLQAEQQLERNFFKRLERLVDVRRFVLSWLVLLVLLAGILVAQIRSLGGYYQTLQPAPGGTYTEGILGSFTNANPIYATNPVDSAVSRLVFGSLFTYNDKNQLVGDLAESITPDARGTTYTVRLRPQLTWHDGKPLTADDVVFTYKVIQNPDAHSPLNSSWQGITVAKVNDMTVSFTLPNILSSFPYSLTNGIIPKHLLEGISMASMRTLSFNTRNPIGAGPFMWNALEVSGSTSENREEHIELRPFDHYHAGKPKLDRFVIHSFRSQDRLVSSFEHQEVAAMVGLNQVPENLQHDSNVREYSMPLTAAVMTFFRTTEGILSDTKVRQALVRATDTAAILKSLDYPAQAVREPLLRNQVGYNPTYAEPSFDLAAANAMLEAQGWQKGEDGLRHKGNTALTFKLYAQSSGEYAQVARLLAKQWRAAGVDVSLVLQDNADFQSTLAYHSYDALLYGVSIGTDPDVFAYWHSSQADIRAPQRLNFSEYKSSAADAGLEAGRTRTDPTLRMIKYQSFLQAWQSDAPAVSLYQPRFLYITRTPVYGLTEHPINADVERFTNVQNWMVRQVGVSDARK